ncbi:sec14 cytosolic factor [Moniliophthora roreri]|uniref:Sec14 cytosolic factor n=1 Tax=Moniliophthora roreri TaxID=221103 RepID=A0A0W0FBQ0_MONRR|nr:sec14 cytosolic factor [Moniliophthora roreri]
MSDLSRATPAPERDQQLLSIGKQCSHEACHLVDFLPFKCQHCQESFCQEHFKVEDHSCPKYDASKHNRVAPSCPFCNNPVAIPPGQDPNVRMEQHFEKECPVMLGKTVKKSTPVCERGKCGKVLYAPIRCDKCRKQFCPAHRFPGDHTCNASATSSSSTGTRPGAPTAASKLLNINTKALNDKASAASAAIKKTVASTAPSRSSVQAPGPVKASVSTSTLSSHSNPFSKTDRRAKAERESQKKALKERAKKGLLSEEEKLRLATAEAEGNQQDDKKDALRVFEMAEDFDIVTAPISAPNHQTILETFRRELFDEGILHEGDTIGTDDETLKRFLRARKYDLVQAKKMFVDAQQWRKTTEGIGIDELYRRIDPFDYPDREIVFECWPIWYHKTDKVGRPVNVQFLGDLNLPKLYKECSPEQHWQTCLVIAESLTREVIPATTRLYGQQASSVLVILDLKGFGLSQFWQMKAIVQKSFQISQDYYPETMGTLAFINAPASISMMWNVLKPWLAKETQEKIVLFGKDYKERLLELVDADSLPKVLGGKCTCPEAGGCHLNGAGPWLQNRKGWGPRSQAKETIVGKADPLKDKVTTGQGVKETTASAATTGVGQGDSERK